MKEKRKFIYSIVGLCFITVLFWGLWIVRAYAWVNYEEFTVTILGTLLIGVVTGMVAVAYLVFRIARTSYMLGNQKKNMVIAIVTIFVVMCVNFFMLHEMRHYGYTISTLAAVEEKESKGGNYYFHIKDSSDDSMVILQCDKETYDALEMDEGKRYSIQYRKLNFGNHKVTLGYIDMNYRTE